MRVQEGEDEASRGSVENQQYGRHKSDTVLAWLLLAAHAAVGLEQLQAHIHITKGQPAEGHTLNYTFV